MKSSVFNILTEVKRLVGDIHWSMLEQETPFISAEDQLTLITLKFRYLFANDLLVSFNSCSNQMWSLEK